LERKGKQPTYLLMISEVGAWQKIGCYLVFKRKGKENNQLINDF
jgi:hypothetical protein